MSAPAKPQTVAIDATLHGYIRILATVLSATGRPGDPKVKIKDLLEAACWNVVRENRARIEAAVGGPIEIPDPAQLQLAAA